MSQEFTSQPAQKPAEQVVPRTEQKEVPLERQGELYELVNKEIGEARTLTDLAEAKRKSLAFDLSSEWMVEAQQDIEKKFKVLLIEETRRLITENGYYE